METRAHQTAPTTSTSYDWQIKFYCRPI